MPKLRFRMIDVFTEVRFGGNPLGVFFDADEIDAAIMQTMARELNMSEIVFLGTRSLARFVPKGWQSLSNSLLKDRRAVTWQKT